MYSSIRLVIVNFYEKHYYVAKIVSIKRDQFFITIDNYYFSKSVNFMADMFQQKILPNS